MQKYATNPVNVAAGPSQPYLFSLKTMPEKPIGIKRPRLTFQKSKLKDNKIMNYSWLPDIPKNGSCNEHQTFRKQAESEPLLRKSSSLDSLSSSSAMKHSATAKRVNFALNDIIRQLPSRRYTPPTTITKGRLDSASSIGEQDTDLLRTKANSDPPPRIQHSISPINNMPKSSVEHGLFLGASQLPSPRRVISSRGSQSTIQQQSGSVLFTKAYKKPSVAKEMTSQEWQILLNSRDSVDRHRKTNSQCSENVQKISTLDEMACKEPSKISRASGSKALQPHNQQLRAHTLSNILDQKSFKHPLKMTKRSTTLLPTNTSHSLKQLSKHRAMEEKTYIKSPKKLRPKYISTSHPDLQQSEKSADEKFYKKPQSESLPLSWPQPHTEKSIQTSKNSTIVSEASDKPTMLASEAPESPTNANDDNASESVVSGTPQYPLYYVASLHQPSPLTAKRVASVRSTDESLDKLIIPAPEQFADRT